MPPPFKLLGLLGLTLAILPSALAQIKVQIKAQLKAEPYVYTGHLSFDIAKIPFSRYGSYLAFSQLTPEDPPAQSPGTALPPGVYLRNMHGDQHPVFRVELLAGDTPVPFHVQASPSLLHLQADKGSIDICIAESDQVRFRGNGVSLRLTAAQPGALAVPNYARHWEVNSDRAMEKYMLWATRGNLRMDAPWTGTSNLRVVATFSPDADDPRVEGEIDTYPSVWTPHPVSESFDQSVRAVERDYSIWLKRVPSVPKEFGPGAELAAYIDWASVVKPDGFLDRPAMLMSKNGEAAVWSWDNCFNAMALSFNNPDLAWQQYMLPFDNQAIEGALPDMIKDSLKEFNFTKPPIHGWALAWMMQHGGYSDQAHLAQFMSRSRAGQTGSFGTGIQIETGCRNITMAMIPAGTTRPLCCPVSRWKLPTWMASWFSR